MMMMAIVSQASHSAERAERSCTVDVYQRACCKFRSDLDLKQIYALFFFFSLSLSHTQTVPPACLPASLPPLGATGVGYDGYEMSSH